MTVALLPEFTFPTVDFVVAQLSERVDALGERLGFAVTSWEADGLGTLRGAALRLPSGLAILVQESVHEVEAYGAMGPTVLVDATDLGTRGPAALVEDLIVALQLKPSAILWQQSASSQAHAARVAIWSREYSEAKRLGRALPDYPIG
jgi:hypothetical protein